MRRDRTLLMVLDGVGLIGILVFSVLAALEPEQTVYTIGQIFSAGLVLATVLLLRRANRRVREKD